MNQPRFIAPDLRKVARRAAGERRQTGVVVCEFDGVMWAASVGRLGPDAVNQQVPFVIGCWQTLAPQYQASVPLETALNQAAQAVLRAEMKD